MSDLTFEQKLTNYADLLLRVGLNFADGDRLRLGAPLEAAPLVRLLAGRAWALGALDVDVHYSDAALTRLKYAQAPEAALDYAPDWSDVRSLRQIEEGYRFLSLSGVDPDLLAGIDQGRVARASRAAAVQGRSLSEQASAFAMTWSAGAVPVPAWARRVFPGLSDDEATARLWDAIFTATRADQPDPVGAWQAHLARLAAVREWLDGRQYAALHFRSAHTDLTVGLADGHRWMGGATTSQRGVVAVPNLPTDEVFTAPHRGRVDGTVRASKPLSVRGTLIEDIEMTFAAGRVTRATASSGQEVLTALLDTDEGARQLGEVALVEADAPVARTGLLFYNTLFDENAASHIALGRAYPFTVAGELAAAGGNDSLIHVDWMIGTPETDVDGLTAAGERESVMRAGRWMLPE